MDSPRRSRASRSHIAATSQPRRQHAMLGESSIVDMRDTFLSQSPRGYSDSIGGASAVSDVVVDAFQAAFKWAAGPATSRDGCSWLRFHAPDRDITRRRVLGWLTVIARRLALHRIAQSSSRPTEHYGCDYDSCPDAAEESEPPPSGHRTQLRDALVHLQQGERDVLQLSLQWYDPELRQFNLPRGEAARVAASLGISAGHLSASADGAP
jgi:hypothetical protein